MVEVAGTKGPFTAVVITILVDHNIEGQASLMWQTLLAEGWHELIPTQMMMFEQIKIPYDSSDRVIWRFAQAEQMILLTANRNTDDEDSLERTIQEENTPTSLPVLTIGNADRISERNYRDRCLNRLIEILLDLEKSLGAGRLYIP